MAIFKRNSFTVSDYRGYCVGANFKENRDKF